ncbi:FtsW/RodA/SpoVE family cell cycle protein [Oribacterium parvum]|uniref:FtsW/RodA/SpoVE family cell cycle protein n=1 Tax=Oribacterium parvum TaxID=1501329 RepID=UPI0028E7879B|nr:FtsW/RodA/SpoVE family cell cycle protein [Oribacterium parvum]
MSKKKKLKHFYDFSLVVMVFSITLFGLLMLYSASGYMAAKSDLGDMYYLTRQGIFALAGFLIMLFLSRFFDYHWLSKLNILIYVAAWGALIATFVMGVASHGSSRWIRIMGVQFQPSELMKPAVIIMLATLLTDKGYRINSLKAMFRCALYALIPAAVVALTNLSTGIIIVSIAIFMLFVAVKSYRYHLVLLLATVVGYIGAYPLALFLQKVKILHGYQITRILAWRDPASFPDDTYQTRQGLYAIASGGIFGKGLGESIQKFLMPEAQNDMIFTIICEELGLVGAVGLMLVYALILSRLYEIAKNAKDLFGSFLVIGVMAHIALQAILNIAVASNSIPNTGITLPFVSYGGTSLLILLAELGLCLNVSWQTTLDVEKGE